MLDFRGCRGSWREVEAQGGRKPPKPSIALDFGGCRGLSKPRKVESPPKPSITLDFGGGRGRSKPREVENPQNRASRSISGVVEGRGGRLKPREVENPPNRASRSILGVVEGCRSPGRSKAPQTEHHARFRGSWREVEAQGGRKPPKPSIALDFGGC